ncbi:MAG TPA: ABC transporter ATP-binding protein [Trebonia sp.]|jgi:branched-chain amino acid transport system ATP-binding protein|nr:ABC transporter ATP-binding protein [Trebonia sp.]
MPDAILTVDDLTLHFGSLAALSGVSFDVRPGETFGVIGPNGAGKTTLLNCISGTLRPSSGTVNLRGDRLTGLSAYKVARLGIARTFQIAESFRSFTVLDYVLLGRSSWRPSSFWRCGISTPGTSRADREQVAIARGLLAKHGLSDVADRQLRELSYGHQKMADMVRALAAEPQILLLDEPTSGSSAHERVELREVMSMLRDTGITTVVVDHDVSFVSSSCSRVFAMASGAPIGIGTPQEVLAMPELIQSYLGG